MFFDAILCHVPLYYAMLFEDEYQDKDEDEDEDEDEDAILERAEEDTTERKRE